MADLTLESVFVDRKDQGLATHRMSFMPDGVVRSDWFEWGYEEYRDVKANEGRYTRDGSRIQVTWTPRPSSMIESILAWFKRKPGAVVAYQLKEFDARTFLVRENSIQDFERWATDPMSDKDRVPPGTYLPL